MLTDVVGKCYISLQSKTEFYTSFYLVPKGIKDIRMINDSTKSGLNSKIWIPGSSLPIVHSLLQSIIPGVWMRDLDIGEMFLNFNMYPQLIPLCMWTYKHIMTSR